MDVTYTAPFGAPRDIPAFSVRMQIVALALQEKNFTPNAGPNIKANPAGTHARPRAVCISIPVRTYIHIYIYSPEL